MNYCATSILLFVRSSKTKQSTIAEFVTSFVPISDSWQSIKPNPDPCVFGQKLTILCVLSPSLIRWDHSSFIWRSSLFKRLSSALTSRSSQLAWMKKVVNPFCKNPTQDPWHWAGKIWSQCQISRAGNSMFLNSFLLWTNKGVGWDECRHVINGICLRTS